MSTKTKLQFRDMNKLHSILRNRLDAVPLKPGEHLYASDRVFTGQIPGGDAIEFNAVHAIDANGKNRTWGSYYVTADKDVVKRLDYYCDAFAGEVHKIGAAD